MSEPSPWALGPRIALTTGVPFGLVMGVMSGLQTGSFGVGAAAAVFAGLAFGLTFAAVITMFSSARGAGASRAGPRQERTLRIQGDRTALLEAARRALHQQGIARFDQDDPELGLLEGTTGMNMQSFGTVVTVNVAEGDDGFCKVHIRSTPRFSLTMVDYGVAASLVEEVERAVVDAGQVMVSQEVAEVSARQVGAARRRTE